MDRHKKQKIKKLKGYESELTTKEVLSVRIPTKIKCALKIKKWHPVVCSGFETGKI